MKSGNKSDIFGRGYVNVIDWRSYMAFKILPHFNDENLGVATAFLYDWGDLTYVVTNWHNVTGRHPETLKIIHSSRLAIPNWIELHIPYFENGPRTTGKVIHLKMRLALYSDEDMREPRWLEHPDFRQRVDVIAIPLGPRSENPNFQRVDRGQTGMRASVGTDAFILGFPRGISGGQMPIWKRASIATEAYTLLDGLPKFYVDTASREGMSGSPVIIAANGPFHTEWDGSKTVSGIAHRFIGVYSGRKGDSVFEAQLGIVWKESALVDIVEGGVVGIPSPDHTPVEG